MGDLISRQAAISDFEWCKSQAIDKDRWQEAINRVNALPSADAVEVVRCRDCKYYDLAKNGFNGICNRQYATFDADDFCSYGERKV